MAKTLAAAIAQVQAYALSVKGINLAPTLPLEAVEAMPFAIAYPSSGTLQADDASSDRDIHTVFCEVHLSPTALNISVGTAMTLLTAFGKLLKQNPTLNNTVNTIIYPIRYTFGHLEWNDEAHLGFRFEIDIKQRNSLA